MRCPHCGKEIERECDGVRRSCGGDLRARPGGRPRGGEIVAVVFIVVFLAGMLLSFIPRPVSELGKRGVCISNLKSIGLALRMYSSDFNENFPYDSNVPADRRTVSALSLLIPDYAEDVRTFGCPSDKNYGKTGSTAVSVHGAPCNRLDNHCSYAYAYLCNEQTADETVLLADRSWGSETGTVNSPWGWSGKLVKIGGLTGANHGMDGVNVLFKGGDAKWIPTWRIAADILTIGYHTDGDRHIDVPAQLYDP
jgi:hypothetical protein